ncbi:MAG: hypothetical protein IJZ65_00835 [Ruminiclostridium sp.]|nr:hypothetical protein [Ruminiclostridium sp.]MBQ8841159.1 hypothetical protein [Ruminiclostridium sp.]
MKIIKANSYLPVSGEPFSLPLPLKLELYYSNILLCVYIISEDGTVDFTYNVNTDIPILTPVHRKLKIEDIYFLIRSRIFPDNPYIAPAELMRLGLSKYEPYDILLRTHGILQNDCYWLRPGDEDIDYTGAMEYYLDFYRLTPEQRAEKYRFKDTGTAEEYKPEAFEGIESFLGM